MKRSFFIVFLLSSFYPSCVMSFKQADSDLAVFFPFVMFGYALWQGKIIFSEKEIQEKLAQNIPDSNEEEMRREQLLEERRRAIEDVNEWSQNVMPALSPIEPKKIPPVRYTQDT